MVKQRNFNRETPVTRQVMSDSELIRTLTLQLLLFPGFGVAQDQMDLWMQARNEVLDEAKKHKDASKAVADAARKGFNTLHTDLYRHPVTRHRAGCGCDQCEKNKDVNAPT